MATHFSLNYSKLGMEIHDLECARLDLAVEKSVRVGKYIYNDRTHFYSLICEGVRCRVMILVTNQLELNIARLRRAD